MPTPSSLSANSQLTHARYGERCKQTDVVRMKGLQKKGARKEMKRIIAIVIGTLLALVVAVPMVLAQSQGGAPQDVEGSIDLEPGAVFGNCEFPVRYEFSGKAKTIELPGDRFIFTSPGLTATLTNLDNGNQETVTITGAFHQTTLENGDVRTVATGRNLLGDPEAGFVVAVGRFSYVFDAQGNFVQPLTGQGQLIDVCELLA